MSNLAFGGWSTATSTVTSGSRLAMMITPDRVSYFGLFGAPSRRTHGAHTVYVALESPFEIRVGGGARESAWLAFVPGNTPHEIASADRLIADLLIEPESVHFPQSRVFPRLTVATRTAEYMRVRRGFEQWLAGNETLNPDPAAFDEFFFGTPLERRPLDPRIARAVQAIRAQPCEQFLAADCARLTGLSFSRFVHLFKEEIGMTFRAFCAWKRARAALPHMTSACNLTNLAMQTGYPDSTHFSHSIRRIFGLRPRDILAGSRRIALQYEL